MSTINANLSAADQTQLNNFQNSWGAANNPFTAMNQELNAIRDGLLGNTTYLTRTATQVRQSAGGGTVTLNGSGFITTGLDIAGVGTTVTSVSFQDGLGRNLLNVSGTISMVTASNTTLGVNSMRIGDIARGGEVLLTGANFGFTQTDTATGSSMTLTGGLSSIVVRQRLGTEEYQYTLTGNLTLGGSITQDFMTGSTNGVPTLGAGSVVSGVTINRLTYVDAAATTPSATAQLLSVTGAAMSNTDLIHMVDAIRGNAVDSTFGVPTGGIGNGQVNIGSFASAPGNALTLVSGNEATGLVANNFSKSWTLSADGRYVLFNSDATNLVANDTNGVSDVFLKDTQTGAITLVSTNAAGSQATGGVWGSNGYDISADGRYVAMVSDATNLVAGDTNGVDDVFIKDTLTGAVTRVSTDATGNEATGGIMGSDTFDISANGRYVVIGSDASNLVANDTNNAWDIFLKDTQTGTITRVNTAANGAQVTGSNEYFGGIVSEDGRYVVFESNADNLVVGDTNGLMDIFKKDTLTGAITQVNTDAAGMAATGGVGYVDDFVNWSLTNEIGDISADGRYVTFSSSANNLVAGDFNGVSDVFVKDTQTGAISRVSTDTWGAEATAPSSTGGNSLSANGRYVVFQSDASNLVTGDTNGMLDVFVKDLWTNAVVRVNIDAMGGQAVGGTSGSVRISDDGSTIVFRSGATNLVAGHVPGVSDVVTVANPFMRANGSRQPGQSRINRLDSGQIVTARIVNTMATDPATGSPILDATYTPIITQSELQVARFNADGTPDTAFGTGGQFSMALTPDDANNKTRLMRIDRVSGNMLVTHVSQDAATGGTVIATTRINAAGGATPLDPIVIPAAASVNQIAGEVRERGDGSIVHAGLFDNINGQSVMLTLHSSAGALNATQLPPVDLGLSSSFTYLYTVADNTNAGNINVVLDDMAGGPGVMLRFTAAGAPDATFGVNGRVNFSSAANDVRVLADGRMLVLTFTPADQMAQLPQSLTLRRYTANGVLDSTYGNAGAQTVALGFDGNGWQSANWNFGVDGRLVVAGIISAPYMPGAQLTVARFNADGTLDTSFGFGGSGQVNTWVNQPGIESVAALANQPDGSVLVTTMGMYGNGQSILQVTPDGMTTLQSGAGGYPAGWTVDPTTGDILQLSNNYQWAPTGETMTTQMSRITATTPIEVINQGMLGGNDAVNLNIGGGVNFNGQTGNDNITAGIGNDVLDGGAGNDTLTGGAGADRFVFSTPLNATTNVDTITDFTAAEDKIVLSPAQFGGISFNANGSLVSSSSLSTTGAAVGTNAQIIYNSTTGALSYDADGTGATAAVRFATLGATTHPTITAANIVSDAFGANVGPSLPTLSVSPVSVNAVSEGNAGSTPMVFQITRQGDTSGTSSVNWAVVGAGAGGQANAADFAGGLASGVANFAAGAITQLVTVQIAGDTVAESNESFGVQLSAANGATIANGMAMGTINNDDVPSANSFSITPSTTSVEKNEGNAGQTAFVYTVTRANTGAAETVAWNVNTQGWGAKASATDFVGNVLPSGTLNFAAGAATATITVLVAGDTVVENNEWFGVNVVGGNQWAWANSTIANDDDEAGATLATAGNIGMGSQIFGGLQAAGDVDWYKVNLTAGITYGLGAGSSSPTTTLTLKNSTGAAVTLPAGSVTSSSGFTTMSFTPTVSGDYYLSLQGGAAGSMYGMTTEILGRDNWGATNATAGRLVVGAEGPQFGRLETGNDSDRFLIHLDPVAQPDQQMFPGQSNFYHFELGLQPGLSGVSFVLRDAAGAVISAPTTVLPPGANGNPMQAIALDFNPTVAGDYYLDVVGGGTAAASVGGVYDLSSWLSGTNGNFNTPAIPGAQIGLVALSSYAGEGSAGQGSYVFSIRRSGDSTPAVTVDWIVQLSGVTSADASAADFASGSLPFGQVTLGAGEVEKSFTVALAADTLVELDERFVVQLANPVGATIIPGYGSVTGTIANDDVTTGYGFTMANGGDVTEGGNLVLTFTRSGPTNTAASVTYGIAPQGGGITPANPVAMSDFGTTAAATAFPQGTVNFAVGANTATVTVATFNDTQTEGNEAFVAYINAPVGVSINGPQYQAGRILDNDGSSFAISLVDQAAQFAEGGNVVFNVERIGSATTVDWVLEPSGISAATAADFGATPGTFGTLTFSDTVSMQSVTIPVTADMLDEANETFNIRLTNLPANSTLVGTGSVQGTITGQGITDDFANGYSAQTQTLPYGTLTSAMPVAGSIEQIYDVDWFQINVTAAGSYVLEAVGNTPVLSTGRLGDPTLTLYAADGITELAFDDDSGDGLNSRINYTLATGNYYAAVRAYSSGTGNYTLSMQSAAAANSNASITAFSPVQSEGNSGVTSYMFQVSRSSAVGAASVDWAVAGNGLNPTDTADFTGLLSGTVNFADGQALAYVTVNVQGDTTAEANENFEVTLSNGVGVNLDPIQSKVIATISNDDVTVTTAQLTLDAPATGSVSMAYERDNWTLNIGAAGNYVIDMVGVGATPLGDTYLTLYDANSLLLASNDDSNGTLNSHIEYALTAGTYTVEARGFGSYTGDYQLLARSATAITGTEVIVAPVAGMQSEGNSSTAPTPFVFNVTRSNTVGGTPLTWSLSGLGPTGLTASDFVATSGTVNFATGATTAQITVNVTGDTAIEADETFGLTIATTAASAGNTTILNPTAYATIVNDDEAATAYVSTPTTAVREGGNVVFTVGRTGNIAVASTVQWDILGAGLGATTVTSGDFVGASPMTGLLTFAAGSTASQNVTVRVASDTTPEYDESFRFALSATDGTNISSVANSATVAIQDGSVSDFAISTTRVGLVEGNGTTAAPAATYTYTVTRTGDLSRSATIDWQVQSTDVNVVAGDFAGATGGTLPGGRLTFAAVTSATATSQTQTITVRAVGDTGPEGDEAFSVVLSNASGASTVSTDRAQGIILNDDQLSTDNTRATATNLGTLGATMVTRTDFVGASDTQDYYRFTLGAASDFHLQLTGLSSDADVELQNSAGVFIDSSIWADSHDEAIDINNLAAGDYYVLVDRFAGDTTYNLSVSATTAQRGVLSFDMADLSVAAAEGSTGVTQAVFTVNRTGDTSGYATVDWSLESFMSTLDGADFSGGNLPSDTLVFAAGAASATITVNIAGDTQIEADEYYTLNLFNANNAVIDLPRSMAFGSITNDDVAQADLPTVSIQATATDNPEGDVLPMNFVFTVTRTGNLTLPSTVNWDVQGMTSDVTAADFVGNVLPSGTVAFLAGESVQTVTVQVAADAVFEGDEAFAVSLSLPTTNAGAQLNPRNSIAGGLIRNDDMPSTFSIDGLVADNMEGNAPFTFRVSRAGDASAAADVNWEVANLTTSNADFSGAASTGVPLTGTLNFAAGISEQFVTVQVAADANIEQDERFMVRLSHAVGGGIDPVGGIAVGTIRNDDQLNVFGIEAVDNFKPEGDSGASDFVFRLTSSTGSGTVNWQVGGFTHEVDGEDFVGGTRPSGSYTFTGQFEQLITVQVAGDYMAEGDELFYVALNTPTGGVVAPDRNLAMGVVIDNDSYVDMTTTQSVVSVSAVDGALAEGNTGVTTNFVFNVTRSGDLTQAVNVNYLVAPQASGLNAADFVGNALPTGIVNFASGISSVAVTVGVVGDTAQELNEAFALVIESTDPNVIISDTGAAARAVILNDDTPPEVSISALDGFGVNQADKAEGSVNGGATPFVFRVARSGNLDSASTVNWAVASNFGTAAAGDFAGATAGSVLTGTQRPSGTVTFAAGISEQFVTVNVAADMVREFDEVFRVDLSLPAAANAAIAATGRSAFGQIRTDDLADTTVSRVSIEATGAVLNEGTGVAGVTPYVFTLRRSGNLAPAAATTVNWSVTADSTAAANDFATSAGAAMTARPSGTVTFAAGVETATITVNVLADNVAELDEAFSVSINTVTNGEAVASSRVAQGLIRNDDVMSAVRVDRVAANGTVISDMAVTEGSGTASTPVIYKISRAAGGAAGTLNWALDLSGSQSASTTDFLNGVRTGSVSFAAGDTEKLVTVNVVADRLVESNEMFTFRLNDAPGVSFAQQQLAMVISDDDDDYGNSTTATGSGRLRDLGSVTGATSLTPAINPLGNGGNISPGGDQDWFKVTLAANTSYEFAMGSPDFVGVLSLMDAGGNQIAADVQDGVGNVRDGLTLLSHTTGTTGGDFYISAQAANGAVGMYGLQVNIAGRDDYTANANTIGRLATTGAPNLGRIESAGDVDWFRVNLTNGGMYQFAAQATAGISAGRVRLVDSTGAILATGDMTMGSSFEYRAQTAGTAYLSVDGGGGTGFYGLTARTLNATDATVVPTVDIVATASSSQTEGNAGTTPFVFELTRTGNTQFESRVSWNVSVPTGADVATLVSDLAGASYVDMSSVGNGQQATFTGSTGVVNFAAGQESVMLTINVRGDALVESDERFNVNLTTTNTTNAILGNTTAVGVIRNDDALPEVSIRSVSVSAAEGTAPSGLTPFYFEVTRSGNTSGVSTVNWTRGSFDTNVTAADFSGAATGTVSFAAGETSKLLTINVAQDSIEENDESFYVQLSTTATSGAVLGNNTAVSTIVNDDQPGHLAVVAREAVMNEGNTGATPFIFTVTRSGDLAAANVAVDWALTGTGANAANATDFQGNVLPRGTITFAANEAARDITINVAGDFDIETAESFAVTLSTPRNAVIDADRAIGTIGNDDLPVVSISSATASAAESVGARVFTLTRSSPLGVDQNGNLTVNGDLTVNWGVDLSSQPDGNDFTGATGGSVTFTGTQLTSRVTLSVVNDTAVEADETILVNVQAGTGYVVSGVAGTATSVITNNDVGDLSTVADAVNNNLAGAVATGVLVNRTNRVLNNWVGSTDTNDYYAFTVGATSSFTLTLDRLANDADLQLLDANGTVIGGSYAWGSNTDTVRMPTLAAGDYYARVYQYSGNTNYTLTMNATAIADAGNNSATATGARNVGPLSGTPLVYSDSVASNDSDYYRFTTAAVSNFRLSLEGLTDNADVYLLASDGRTVVASSTNVQSRSESISEDDLAAGTYYVWVSPMVAAVGDSTPYTLTLSAENAAESTVGGEDRSVDSLPTQGTVMTPVTFNATTGVATRITGAVSSTDRNDYYRVDTSAMGARDFTLNLTGMTANADVQLVNASGVVVGEGHASGRNNERFTVNNLAADVYYVRVYRQSGNTNYSLDMTAAAVALPTDTDALYTQAATLGALSSTQVVRSDTVGFAARPYAGETGDNGIDSGDFYKFTLGAASRIEVSLSDLTANADVTVYSSNGTSIVVPNVTNTVPTSNPTGTTSELFTTNTALAAGQYYVRVNSVDGIGTGYRLGLRTLPTGDTGFDSIAAATTNNITFNATTGAASYNGTAIPATGLTGLVGTLNGVPDNNDYYRFTTTSMRQFTLNLRGLNDNADVQLLGSNGTTVIASSVATGTTSDSITVNNLAAGTYYARIYYNGTAASATNYSLSMTTATLPTDADGVSANATAITLTNGTWTSTGTQNVGFAAQPATGAAAGSDTDGIDANDYYRFTTTGSNYVQVALTGLRANADVELINATALTGTIDATNSSTTVTGTGTTFTSQLTTGSIISIGGSSYTVSAIANDTSLTLATSYSGATATGLSVNPVILPEAGQNHAIGASPEIFTTSAALAAGTYYVRVLSPSGASAGTNYSVSVRTFADDYVAALAGTKGQLGTPTTTAVTAIGNIQSIGDVDWFAVSMTAGKTYTISQYNGTGQTLMDSSIRGIYNSAGVLQDNSANDDWGNTLTQPSMDAMDSQVVFTASATGTYYIAAAGYGSNLGSYTVSVQERTNAAPVVSNTPVTQTAMEGQAFSYRLPWNTFTDPERQAMTYTATLGDGVSALPTWLTFDANSQMFSGTPVAGSADLNIRVTARDTGVDGVAGNADDLTSNLSFMVNTPTSNDDFRADFRTTGRLVVGDNERNSVSGNIETANDQDWFRVSMTAGTTYVIDLRRADGAGRLADPFLRGVYSYSATTNATALVANTSNDDANGSPNSQVRFTASASGDYFIAAGGFGRNTGAYTLSVINETNTNRAPTLTQYRIADQVAIEGQAWRFTIPSTAFADLDSSSGTPNGQLTYSAELSNGNDLPAWLRFDERTRTFSGTPTGNDLSIVVTARDGGGLRVSDTFSLRTPTASQANVSGTGRNDWTIMVYMAADNNLDPYALKDLNEMESVTLPSGVKVVFMLDRRGANNSYRGVVTNDSNLNTAASLTLGNKIAEVNSGDPTTLTDFIDWTASNHTADHYGLVVWDHGGGLSGTCWDETSSNANLSVADTTTAIQNSVLADAGFDMIGFDTCLQGMIEQAYDLRDVTRYVVASQNLEPGDGWDYASWLQTVAANPAMTARQVASAAVQTYGDAYNNQQTLSAVHTGLDPAQNGNSNGLVGLRDAINAFITSTNGATAGELTALRNARNGVTNYNNSNYLDLGGYMSNVAAATTGAISTNAAAVTAALAAAVVSTTQVGGAGSAGLDDSGLSVFLPGSRPAGGYTSSQFQFVNDTNWGSYINTLAA